MSDVIVSSREVVDTYNGVKCTVYSAWVPYDLSLSDPRPQGYHVITYIGDACYGQLGTERFDTENLLLSDYLVAPAASETRVILLMRAHQKRVEKAAIEVIMDARPELRSNPHATIEGADVVVYKAS